MIATAALRRPATSAAMAFMLCAAAFCQDEAAEPQEPGPSAGPTKAQLELRYEKGDEARYKFNQSSFVAVKGIPGLAAGVSGEPFEVQAKGVMYEKLLGVTEDGNYEMKTAYERAHVLQGERALSFAGEDLPSATVVLSKLGKLVATKSASPGAPVIANQPWASSARPPSSWVVFSGGEVSSGSKWTTDVPLALTGFTGEGPLIKVTHVVEGFEESHGFECARVLMTAEGPLELKGIPVYGTPADVTLDFAIAATAWIRTSDGRLVRLDQSARLSMLGAFGEKQEAQTGTSGTQFETGVDSTVTVELISQGD